MARLSLLTYPLLTWKSSLHPYLPRPTLYYPGIKAVACATFSAEERVMADMIPTEIVTETWQRMAQTSVHEAPDLVNQMQQEQPAILAHLLYLDEFPFDPHERELIFYIGMVVWQIMKQSKQRLRRVALKKLSKAEKANYDTLELLASDSEADFFSATVAMVENHPEPEVMRYIVETIMDEEDYDPDDPPIRDEYRGLAFIHLKIALDALISSLA